MVKGLYFQTNRTARYKCEPGYSINRANPLKTKRNIRCLGHNEWHKKAPKWEKGKWKFKLYKTLICCLITLSEQCMVADD